MEITYTSTDFPPTLGNRFRGDNTLQFTVPELLWSAITVGRRNFIDVMSHGKYSIMEILYRASMVMANLAMEGNNLTRSAAYNGLDPSEKGAVSYFMGMTMSKLLALKLLDVAWLLHIDVYRDQLEQEGVFLAFSGNCRPDLIGYDTHGRWVVMESKGRTNIMRGDLLNAAKEQTTYLDRIGTESPYLRIGIVTHFPGDRMKIDWSDPDKPNKKKFTLKTDKNEYLKKYYTIVGNVLETEDTSRIGEYTIHNFEEIDLSIGMRTQTLQRFREETISEGIIYYNPTEFRTPEYQDQTFFSGPDGVVVGVGNAWFERLRTNKKG